MLLINHIAKNINVLKSLDWKTKWFSKGVSYAHYIIALCLTLTVIMQTNSVNANPIITNTATANFSINGSPSTLTDSVQFTKDTVVRPPDILTIQKQANVTTAEIGDLITYTVQVNNSNLNVLTNVSITDILPLGLNYQTNTAKINNNAVSNSQINLSGNNLTIDLGNIPANTNWSISYDVLVSNSAPLGNSLNRVTATSDTATSNESQAQVLINPDIVPLQLQKVVNVGSAKVGDSVTFTISLDNTNNSIIEGIVINDSLPTGLEFISGTANLNGTQIAPNTTNGLSFSIGDIPANTQWTLTYDALITADSVDDSLTNSATASATNANANSNTDSATVNIVDGDIVITKSVNVPSAHIGESVVYTVSVHNPANHALNDVVLTDTLPNDFELQNNSVTVDQQQTNNVTVSGSNFSVNLGTLGATETATVSYTVSISESATHGDSINTVRAESNFASSNDATATVNVRTPSLIEFLKIDAAGSNEIIRPTSYNADQNGGTAFQQVSSITLTDGSVISLPTPQPIINANEYSNEEPIVIQVTDLDQNIDPTNLETIIVTITIPGTNDSEVLLLTETGPNTGIFRGFVQTTRDSANIHNGILTIADQEQINVSYFDQEDNTDTSATAAMVVPNTPLYLSKSSDKYSASIGELIKYNLEFKNTTGTNLTNVAINDLLPVGFRYISNSAYLNGNPIQSGITSNGRSLNITLPNMPSSATWSVEYLSKITAGVQIGKSTNSATLSSGDLKSNVAKATVTVKDDLMRSKNILTGRVYIGCQTKTKDDIPPKVLKDARVYMETGRSVLTDVEGFWHMEGVQPGAHVLQLDTESIEGYEPLLCIDNTRRAHDAKSKFIDLNPGSLWHVDFHVKPIEGYVKKSVKLKAKIEPINPIKLYGKDYIKTAKEGFEILWPKHNYVPPIDSTKIIVKSSPKHRVEVFLNGEKVSHLNYDGSDTNKARTISIKKWVGVDLDIKNKNNTLLAVLKDKNGKELARKTHNIHISGNPYSAEFLPDQSTLLADGKSIPEIVLKIRDEDGFPMRANTHGYFTLENSRYQIKTLDQDEDDNRNLNESLAGSYKYLIEEGGIARIQLNPTTQSGEVKLNINFVNEKRKSTEQITAWLKPSLREWIMVGIAEGTLAYKKLSGNTQTLKDLDKSDKFYKRGRIAFYAKGQVRGKYLLTLAYDTHKPKQKVGSQLNGNIDPDAWYTVYADNSNSQYEAPSSRKLYVKVEKDNFYALFGDYHSGMTITQLASYERVLNGIKTEYKGERFSFNGFISETSNNHHHEEIPGDGTSGLYQLTKFIIPNSETIKIETRDRFHSDRVVESRTLTRYQDYSIDYDSGTLFFKFPIPSRDQNFNPNIIVIDYDSEEDTNKSITAGGRVAVKSLNGKLETGLSVINEGKNGQKDNQLVATDITYKVTPDTTLKAEYAQSKTEESSFDKKQAYILELEKEIEQMEARLYHKKTDENFGIDAQASESGTQKTGAEVRYKLNKNTHINAAISHQKNLDNSNERKLAEVLVDHRIKQVEVRGGVRHTSEKISTDTDQKTINNNTILLGGSYTTKNNKVTYRGEIEKKLESNNGSEISPDRAIVGVDVHLKQGFSVFAEHETTDNGDTRTHNSRVGVNKKLWKGATGKSTYTQERTDQGQRNYATLGLSQKIKINDKLSADFSIDQAKTISSNIPQYRFNDDEPQIQGTQTDDYTAFSVGLGSNDKDWSWTTRAEYRNGEIEDKTNFIAGLIRHYTNGKNVSAKLSYYNSEKSDGDHDESIKLSFGSAWHPKEKDFVFLNRLDLIHQDKKVTSINSENAFDSLTDSNTNKIIHNMHYYRKLNEKTEYSVHHGIKYVEDKNAGISNKTTIDTGTIEFRRDITKRVDIGVHGGYLHDWKGKTVETLAGVSVGVTPVKNAWAELGYNFEGFDDEDFDDSNFKRKGPYLDFRYKFNQDTLRGDLPVRRKVDVNKEEIKKAQKETITNKNKTTYNNNKKPVVKKEAPKLETIDRIFDQNTSVDIGDEDLIANYEN